jgi:hypothetical protein
MTRRSHKPHDRLTWICDRLLSKFESDPHSKTSDRICIFITGDETSGLVLGGYEDDLEAMTDLLIHMKKVFEANGKNLMILPINNG